MGTSTAEYHQGNEIYSTKRKEDKFRLWWRRTQQCLLAFEGSFLHVLPLFASHKQHRMLGAMRVGIRSCQRLDGLCICFRAFRRVKETFSVSSNGREEKVFALDMSFEGEEDRKLDEPDWIGNSESVEIAPIKNQTVEQSELGS